MTEAEWRACLDPEKMLAFLGDRASARKLRLFAVACCRRIWPRLPGPDWRRAVEVCERFADGQAGVAEWVTIGADLAQKGSNTPAGAAVSEAIALELSTYAVSNIVRWASWAAPTRRADELLAQSHLVRDVFGDPFRGVTFSPGRLAPDGGTVRKLAQAMYGERRFEGLPVLADALEDAGCADEAVLSHCRGGGEHVRGCWVVDILLGKG
jgi:hypothetical protein